MNRENWENHAAGDLTPEAGQEQSCIFSGNGGEGESLPGKKKT